MGFMIKALRTNGGSVKGRKARPCPPSPGSSSKSLFSLTEAIPRAPSWEVVDQTSGFILVVAAICRALLEAKHCAECSTSIIHVPNSPLTHTHKYTL